MFFHLSLQRRAQPVRQLADDEFIEVYADTPIDDRCSYEGAESSRRPYLELGIFFLKDVLLKVSSQLVSMKARVAY